jgi:hypothetical protein
MSDESQVSRSNTQLHYVAPLTEKNFQSWKFRLQYVLQDRGLWKCVDPSSSSKAKPTAEEEQKAMAQIVLTLSDEVSHIVQRANVHTAREVWVLLCKQFEQKGLSSRVYLRRKLLNIKYVGDSMQQHLSRISELANQLQSVGAGVSDQDLALITLCSLPERYEPFIVQMESRPIEEVTFDFVNGRLLAEAARQEENKLQQSLYGPTAFGARVTNQCTFCNRPGHTEATCWDKHPEQRPKAVAFSVPGPPTVSY